MNASQFFKVLLVRKWTILLVFSITVTTTTLVSFLMPKAYTATTSLVVDFNNTDPLGRPGAPLQFSSMYMSTQEKIISSPRVANKVITQLGLDLNPSVITQFHEETNGKGIVRDWLAERLLKKLTVEPSRDSRIITLEFESGDPKFSSLIANAFAKAYIETALELNIAPARQSAAWFEKQLQTLRTASETAQKRLSQYQNKHEIVTTDERLDTETTKLTVLSRELVTAQAEAENIKFKIAQADRLMLSGKKESETIPEVMNNGFVQGLKAELLHQQADLDELSRSVGENHPAYKSATAEAISLRTKLSTEIKNVVQSLKNKLKLANSHVAMLEKAVASQKEKLLIWKTQREELNVLLNEANNAQNSYDMAMQRANQITLESRVNQTDISILTEAMVPISHSSPKTLLNVILSFILGGILALAAALIRETLDRRIRSAEDVLENLDIPILGVLPKDKENTPHSINEPQRAAA